MVSPELIKKLNFSIIKLNKGSVIFFFLFVDLALLILQFVVFFLLPHKISQNSHFIVVMLIEVEFVFVSEPDLEQVIVKALF
jgi:hypothetical protein